jgi:hypothetical protein
VIDLARIIRCYDAICDMENASAQSLTAAIAYSLDVPPLIGEVKRLRAFYEASMDVLAVLENDLCRFCNHAPPCHADDCPQYAAIRALDVVQAS